MNSKKSTYDKAEMMNRFFNEDVKIKKAALLEMK